MANVTTILVPGGAGYIGSHACKALQMSGFLPVTFDNLTTGHRELVRWGPLEVGDLSDGVALDHVFEHYRPAAVMHFAALSVIGEAVSRPDICYRKNTVATLNLLEAMVRHAVSHIIFSSTCAVYGYPDRVPIGEETDRKPINPYGRSKATIEWMLEDFAAAYRMRFVSLRYFNACGADPDGEAGEWHDPESHLIPRILQAVSGQLPALDILGTDYPTPDGTCIRDYIHVTDLAAAHVDALKYAINGGESAYFNLGTGSGYSVREIVAATEGVIGQRVPTRETARRPGDVPILYADPSRANAVLNFAPRHSDLPTIIGTAWAWHKAQMYRLAAVP